MKEMIQEAVFQEDLEDRLERLPVINELIDEAVVHRIDQPFGGPQLFQEDGGVQIRELERVNGQLRANQQELEEINLRLRDLEAENRELRRGAPILTFPGNENLQQMIHRLQRHPYVLGPRDMVEPPVLRRNHRDYLDLIGVTMKVDFYQAEIAALVKKDFEAKKEKAVIINELNKLTYKHDELLREVTVLRKFEKIASDCYCIKDNKNIIADSRDRLQELMVNPRTDMMEDKQEFAIDCFRVAVLDTKTTTFQGLSTTISQQMAKRFGGQWFCFVGTRKRMYNGDYAHKDHSMLDCSVGLLHLLLFQPL